MPAAENDWEVGVPCFDGAGDLYCFADHRAGYERDAQAKSVSRLFKDALLVVWCDGGVDEANFIASTQQGRCNRKDSKRGSSLRAGERREKEDDLSRSGQRRILACLKDRLRGAA